MGLSVRASRILERLHNTIQTPGFQSGVHDLGARLHELRVDGKATVRKREFVNAMAGDGLLSAEEAEVLFKGLAASASIGGDGESASLHEVRARLKSATLFSVMLCFFNHKSTYCSVVLP